MSRPSTKDELLAAAEAQFAKLTAAVEALPVQARGAVFNFEGRDRTVRDVLVHLHEWHKMLLAWVASNKAGLDRGFLPEPYNWKTYGKLNVVFWERHQATPFDEAWSRCAESHRGVVELIGWFTDEELFTKKHFSWTGTTSLGSYAVSATSSHYEWALKLIRRHARAG